MSVTSPILLHQHTATVRITDLNFGNHLSHINLLEFLHDSRALFLKKHGVSELDCFGYGLIVLNLNVAYKNQAFFGDELVIKLYALNPIKSTFTFFYEVINASTQQVIATADIVMACFDIEKQKLARIPTPLTHLLSNSTLDTDNHIRLS